MGSHPEPGSLIIRVLVAVEVIGGTRLRRRRNVKARPAKIIPPRTPPTIAATFKFLVVTVTEVEVEVELEAPEVGE